MEYMNDYTSFLTLVIQGAFLTNIIVQLTKGIIPIPTKLWCIMVSVCICLCSYFSSFANGKCEINFSDAILIIGASFIVSYVAMYGFDTLKELWQRFKEGENINENNK